MSRYSGVSWVRNIVREDGRPDIKTVQDWPQDSSLMLKVPSIVAYQNSDIQRFIWGFEAKADAYEQDKLQWLKLAIEVPGHHKEADILRQVCLDVTNKLKPLDKTLEQAVSDYLREVWQSSLDYIRNKLPEGELDRLEIRPIITVPHIWSDGAKSKTLKAFADAGVPVASAASDGIQQMVHEPCAAALAVIHDKNMETSIKACNVKDMNVRIMRDSMQTLIAQQAGDVIVICDAGGGTIVGR
jgi:molecular chaperone DnaK (HSP70)